MIRCAVVGASGYSGAELVKLLAQHPGAELVQVQADSCAGERWEDLYPQNRHLFRGTLQPFDPAALTGLDVVFLALPHGVSGAAAAELHGGVGKIIDLSGDFRLPDIETYKRWYRRDHPCPHLLGRATYGLPELFGHELQGADFIACAGCYATVSQLAAAPGLALADSVQASLVVSAMSGTSGAGRKADLSLSFSEVTENLRAYRVGDHQHTPEIVAGVNRYTGRQVAVTFVPHLVPIARGILATVVMHHNGGISQAEALQIYEKTYENAPFVRILDPARQLPSVHDVVHTNFCHIAPVVDERSQTLIVLAVIDNLLKGAAGQAVQIMNLVLGLPETTGLLTDEPRPVQTRDG